MLNYFSQRPTLKPSGNSSLDVFFRLLVECDPVEFPVHCAVEGIADIATKEWFDNKLFPFMNEVCDRHSLKYKQLLKKHLVKLNNIYSILPETL